LHSEEFSVIGNNGSDIIVNNEIDLSEVKTENPEENKKPKTKIVIKKKSVFGLKTVRLDRSELMT